ncbi:MAG: CoA transferase, partial [Clostridia bacterium]|nr:CoA transferase [Clostridia bacterium]
MLSGYQILDLTLDLGSNGAKILSDLGADVIKIESPSGSPERALKPFYHDEPGEENSLVFWANNTGKKGVTLDLDTEKGRELFRALAKDADAVMESFPDLGYMDSLGLGYEDLKKINPKIVYTQITPYGLNGPYVEQHWKYTDLTLWAMNGTMIESGYPDRPPVRISTHQVSIMTGQNAALGTMTALFGVFAGGDGSKVEVSAFEAVQRLIFGQAPSWKFHQKLFHRSGPRNYRGPFLLRQVWECKDGNVAVRLIPGKQARTLKTLMDWIIAEGEGEELRQYNFENLELKPTDQPTVDKIEEIMGAFFLKRTKKELFTEALKRRFDLVAVHDAADIVADDQLEYRQFWSEIEHEDIGRTAKYPGTLFVSSEGRWAPTVRAPHLGEHN